MAATLQSSIQDDVFLAGLCCARLGDPGPALVTRVRPAVAAALAGSIRLPPLGLLYDVIVLLSELDPRLVGPAIPGLELRRWDDQVVGPLLAHRRRLPLCDAAAALPPDWRAPAAATLAERIGDALGNKTWWTPASVRAWLSRTDDEIWDDAVSALADPQIREALDAQLRALALAAPIDLSAADVHLVRNLPALASRSQRLLVRQVLEVASRLDAALPRAVRPRARPGPVASGMADEDKYPAGGFGALTTSGSPENLVASELIYMEDGPDVDPFTVRWAEGELLYFTRDEAAHVRGHRRIVVGLSSDLVDARVKDPEIAWQRLVVVVGMLDAVIERVIRWLGEVELHIAVRVVGKKLTDELKALGLALQPWVEAGIISLEEVGEARHVVELAESARLRADVDFVWIGTKSLSVKFHGSPPSTFFLEVGQKPWTAWVSQAQQLCVFLA
jgi:hypothetical protein